MRSSNTSGNSPDLEPAIGDRTALGQLIDYAIDEAVEQARPVTARILGLARKSLGRPGAAETIDVGLHREALQ